MQDDGLRRPCALEYRAASGVLVMGRSALALGWLWDGAHCAGLYSIFGSFTGAVIPHDSRDGGEQYGTTHPLSETFTLKDSSLVTEAVG